MEFHYYKASNVDNLPPYEEYDFAKGIAGYKQKLSIAFVAVHGLKYLGYGTEEEVYTPGINTPGIIVRTTYNGNGNRY